MTNETVGYVDGLINRSYHASQDLKHPEFDVRIKATGDIKAGEIFHVALFKRAQAGVTGGVSYSGTIKREIKENNNNNQEGETF